MMSGEATECRTSSRNVAFSGPVSVSGFAASQFHETTSTLSGRKLENEVSRLWISASDDEQSVLTLFLLDEVLTYPVNTEQPIPEPSYLIPPDAHYGELPAFFDTVRIHD